MRFNFRKIASVLASSVMVSSTIGLAVAANFSAPFVTGGNADVAVVWGASGNAAATDLVAVADIQRVLSTELAKQTASGGSSSSGATATGGDSINLATSNQRLYMNSTLSAARTVLTSTELPNLLADGSATDLTGTAYKYTQKITPSATQILFGKSGESIDPISILSVGSSANSPLLNYTLTLVKNINASDATNVVGTASLKILGIDYTIGANADANNLYLYGSGTRVSVDEGETKTVKVNDVDHTVNLKGATSTTAATIIVDGVQKSVTKGNSYKFPGGFEIYIKDIFYTTKTGTLSNVDLLVGARTLHFVNNSAVRYGADDTTVTGSNGLLGTANCGAMCLNSITVTQAAETSTGDYVKVGDSFTDRVFGGVKVQFASITPNLTDASRDKIIVDTDNSANAKITFESALAGDKGAQTINFAHDTDGNSDSALNMIRAADTGNYSLILKEGATLNISDITIINSGDKGRIVKLISVGPGSSQNDKTTFQDVITGQSFDFNTGTANSSSANIDGQTYYVSSVASTSANITWGAGSAAGTQGTQVTLYPRIKLRNGEWMAILASYAPAPTNNISSAGKDWLVNSTLVDANQSWILPGKDAVSDYETSVSLIWGNESGMSVGPTNITTVGKINYNVTWILNNTATLTKGFITRISTPDCIFNETTGPAILLHEEKTVTGSASTQGEFICIPLTSEGTSTVTPAIGTPVFSDGATLSARTLASNTNKAQAVDVFGTLVERDTSDNNRVTAWYPNDQMYADVLITAPAATVTGSTSSGGGTVKELGSVIVKDSDVASVGDKNLIVVGGSCVNSVAATLLGSATPLCGADFTTATTVGSGQYLIQTFARTGGKVATLVAGYNAEDTLNAEKYFVTQPVDTSVNSKYVGTTETVATHSTVQTA